MDGLMRIMERLRNLWHPIVIKELGEVMKFTRSRRVAIGVILTIVIFLLVFLCIIFLRYKMQNIYCINTINSIATNGKIGVQAVTYESRCDGFGGSDVVSVKLRKKYFGIFNLSKTVFKYDPSEFGHKLSVTWRHHSVLVISIDRVQFIEDQLGGAFGVMIVYKVGNVGNPVVTKEFDEGIRKN